MLSDEKTTGYGDELFECMMVRSVVRPLTVREPGITIEDGYRVSRRFLDRRDDSYRTRAGIPGASYGRRQARLKRYLAGA